MSYLFALLQNLVPIAQGGFLPLDTDYSYQARSKEFRRVLEGFYMNVPLCATFPYDLTDRMGCSFICGLVAA
jgi:hypothetical protein